MRLTAAVLLCLVGLSGCATVAPYHREFIITPRGPGAATRFAISPLTNSDAVTATLNGATYSGQWTVVPDGSSVGRTTVLVPGPEGPRVAVANSGSIQSGGSGRLQLRNEQSGDAISCNFRMDFRSMTGFGECSGTNGRAYDLQVVNVHN